jgi:hypothetical protein
MYPVGLIAGLACTGAAASFDMIRIRRIDWIDPEGRILVD